MHILWRPDCEAAAVGAEAVLLEWLAAVQGRALADPAALRAWARRDCGGFRRAFAAFTGLPAEDPAMLDAAAGWLLGAGIRPDDHVRWLGLAGDPCLRGLAAIGGRLGEQGLPFSEPPVWPAAPDASPA